ncbi:MAG: Uma2 family endonuclease [Tepidisphaerales bacterium]
MTTAVAEHDPAGFLLHNTSWAYYTASLWELYRQGTRSVRINFDRGKMEFMTVSRRHEAIKTAVARLLETYTLELRIRCTGFGNVTCRREDLEKGLEPDECYYITTPAPPADAEELDLGVNPPPDIAIEVDIARSSIPRQPIYAAIGVPEIWRFDGSRLTPMRLTADRRYEAQARSDVLPDLDFDVFNRFLAQALRDQSRAVLAFQDWLRSRKTQA